MIMKAFCLFLFILLIAPGAASAQVRFATLVRFESAQIGSGYMGSIENRSGISAGAGAAWQAASLRASISHLPQGDVEPGWTTIVGEYEPDLVSRDRFAIGVRLSAGMHHMDVRNRSEIASQCQEGCMFEAPGYAQGWSSMAGLSAVGRTQVFGNVGLIGAYGLHRLFGGSNSGGTFGLFNAGLEYRAP